MPDRSPLRRRTLLGATITGLATSLVLAGCDDGDEIAPPRASGSPSVTSEPSTDPEPSLDEALVEEVMVGLGAAVTVLTGAREAPPLRPALTPLLRAHRRHQQVLSPDGQRPSVLAPMDAAYDVRAVRHSERELRAVLVGAATRAESGALARLLASMAASVTQHLAVLPLEPAEPVS